MFALLQSPIKVLVKIKSTPYYPFLFVLYPLLALLGFNISEVSVNVVWRPMGVLLLAMIVVMILLFILMRNWHRAAISASILSLLFFTYGHAYLYLKAIQIAGVIIGRHRQLLPVWMGLALMGGWWAWKKLKHPESFAPTLNFIAAFLLVFPIYQITSSVLHDSSIRRSTSSQLKDVTADLPLGYAPDIYYILLDAYGRADSLQDIFGYDNTEFIHNLESKGFYVAHCAQSNYAETVLSLSSSLNFNYLDEMNGNVNENSRDLSVFLVMGQYNQARKKLDAMGYNIVAFKTNFPISEWKDADYYLEPTMPGMNDFELLLAETTAWRIPMDFVEQSPEKRSSDWHRRRTTFVLEQLEQTVPEIPGPKFVFAHLVIPHKPFVFGPNGEEVNPEAIVPGQMEFDVFSTGYINQVRFINKQIEHVVDVILAKSSRPPVILIQGDHGPELYAIRDQDRMKLHKEISTYRMQILSAYYLPGVSSELYESITPVNSFRLIFNKYFGEKNQILEDTSRYSQYKAPYQYLNIPPSCP